MSHDLTVRDSKDGGGSGLGALLGVLAIGGIVGIVHIIDSWTNSNNTPHDGRATDAEKRSGQRAKPSETTQAQTSTPRHGLNNVAGMHDLKRLLDSEVVRPLRQPEKYRRYKLSPPNGLLMYGPPGCGKTYIAIHLAEELGHTFIDISPARIGSPYIHESSLKIGELFATAAKKAPTILFIDEIEALVPARGSLDGTSDHKSEEVTTFLLSLNDCAQRGIFVIGATNEPWKIDPAIRRTGRLDKVVYVGPPDLVARMDMLKYHFAGRPMEQGTSARKVATTLRGYSASDIKFLADEAARIAVEREALISSAIIDEAIAAIPSSITPEIDAQYRTFGERGIRRAAKESSHVEHEDAESNVADFDLAEVPDDAAAATRLTENITRKRQMPIPQLERQHRFDYGYCQDCGIVERRAQRFGFPCDPNERLRHERVQGQAD